MVMPEQTNPGGTGRPDPGQPARHGGTERAAVAPSLDGAPATRPDGDNGAPATRPDGDNAAPATRPTGDNAAPSAQGAAHKPGAFSTMRADPEQRRQLVERYAHLVKYVVGRLGVAVPGVFDHDDAMQAGAIGLLQAIDGYRAGSAASFESYALVRIRGSILDAVRSLDTVGRAGREAARAIERAMSELYANLGRVPTEQEVAAQLHVPLARYHEWLQVASVSTVSLDEQDSHEAGGETPGLVETVADESVVDPVESLAHRETLSRLSAAISGLGERQQTVLALYYQDELTLREIGEVLGVTESRVCQIHAEAILALRGRLGGELTGRTVRRPRTRTRPPVAERGTTRPAVHPRRSHPAAAASSSAAFLAVRPPGMRPSGVGRTPDRDAVSGGWWA